MEYMKTKFCVLLWVVMVLVQIRGQNACFEEERIGLLDLKAFLLKSASVPNAVDRVLPKWVDDRAESNCCDWERVTCNGSIGHVMDLTLDNIYQRELYVMLFDHWLLNVSLFLPFKELRTLNLSYNGFGGWIENEGIEKSSSLRKLEVLDLSYNSFNKSSIFQSLVGLASLKILDLSYNGFGRHFPAHGFERLSVLRKLETLNLVGNDLDNRILLPLSAITSLKMLNLNYNRLEGPFPVCELASLENLEMLDLNWNNLSSTSTIPGETNTT